MVIITRQHSLIVLLALRLPFFSLPRSHKCCLTRSFRFNDDDFLQNIKKNKFLLLYFVFNIQSNNKNFYEKEVEKLKEKSIFIHFIM